MKRLQRRRMRRTEQVAAKLASHFNPLLPKPDREIDCDGEIIFDWATPTAMLSVSVRHDGRIAWALTAPGLTLHRCEQFEESVPSGLHKAMDYLLHEITIPRHAP